MKKQKGFTLVEFMVVITILVILSGMIIMTFSNARRNSRDEQAVTDIHDVVLALEQYRSVCGQYPGEIVGSGYPGGLDLQANNGCPTGVNLGTFLAEIPDHTFYYFPMTQDKGSGICYSYHIGVQLETEHQLLANDDDYDSTTVTFGGGGTRPIYSCYSGNVGKFDGSDDVNDYIYDVTPFRQ